MLRLSILPPLRDDVESLLYFQNHNQNLSTGRGKEWLVYMLSFLENNLLVMCILSIKFSSFYSFLD